MLNTFEAENSNLSEMQRTQGKTNHFHRNSYFFSGSSYLCWAFSCASMLRASCSIFIKKLYEAGKICEQRKKMCLEYIMKVENHRKLRNLIAMILLPKKLHQNDQSQAAFLRAAVSRVRDIIKLIKIRESSQIANPTVLEKPGALMLAPIYQLLFGEYDNSNYPSLELTEDQITISYKTYKTDNLPHLQEIVDQKLAPGNKSRFFIP